MEDTVVDIQRDIAFRIIVDHAAAVAAGKLKPRKIGVIQCQVAGVVDRSPIGVDGAVPLEIEVFQHDIRAGVDQKDPPAGGSGDGDNVFSVAAQVSGNGDRIIDRQSPGEPNFRNIVGERDLIGSGMFVRLADRPRERSLAGAVFIHDKIVGQVVHIAVDRNAFGLHRAEPVLQFPVAGDARRVVAGGDVGSARVGNQPDQLAPGFAVGEIAAVQQDVASPGQVLADLCPLRRIEVFRIENFAVQHEVTVIAVAENVKRLIFHAIVAVEVIVDLLHRIAVGIQKQRLLIRLQRRDNVVRIGDTGVDDHQLPAGGNRAAPVDKIHRDRRDIAILNSRIGKNGVSGKVGGTDLPVDQLIQLRIDSGGFAGNIL